MTKWTMLLGYLLLLASCASFERHLDYGTLDSPAMGRAMAYAMYTPPDWQPEERLPLVLFLHGGGDDEDCFDRAGFGPFLDEEMRTGRVPRCVICVPDGEYGFWENWFDGSRAYRDWVLRDLVPYVRERYSILPGREHLHVAGISMGGHGTLRFALFEPEKFDAAVPMRGIYSESLTLADADRLGTIFTVTGHGGTPEERPEIYAKSETLDRLGEITAPVLLMHGELDVRAPFRNFELAVEKLEALGKEFEAKSYPDEGHGFRDPANLADMYSRLEQWFVRHLGEPCR